VLYSLLVNVSHAHASNRLYCDFACVRVPLPDMATTRATHGRLRAGAHGGASWTVVGGNYHQVFDVCPGRLCMVVHRVVYASPRSPVHVARLLHLSIRIEVIFFLGHIRLKQNMWRASRSDW
jgi:hypothetical protein